MSEPEAMQAPVPSAPVAPAGGAPSGAEAAAIPFPSPRTAPAGDPYDEDDEAPVARRYPYTWLHLIVLAVVAFVLGFLVVALWNHGRQSGVAGAEGASAASVIVSAEATVAADPTIAL